MYPTSFRVARPTDKLAEIREFYVTALGLSELGSFSDHEGYDGVMIGVAGKEYHFEFTNLGQLCQQIIVHAVGEEPVILNTAARGKGQNRD